MQALLNTYGDIGTSLVIDLVALYLMFYVLYFRRHWRTDMLLSYVAMNIGVFMVRRPAASWVTENRRICSPFGATTATA